MLAYNSLNNMKEDDDDLKWISEIMEKGWVRISQGEISLIMMECFLRLLVIVRCIWSLTMNNEKEKDFEEGSWTWQKKNEEKVGEQEQPMTDDSD